MLRRHVILQGGAPGSWLVFFGPGVALIAFGVAIVLLPELLVALVAALCILCGLTLVSVGWRLRQAGRAGNGWREPPPGPFVP